VVVVCGLLYVLCLVSHVCPFTLSCFFKRSLGLIIGIAVSSVMMNVIKGAVNTLIVCYADAPAKLEENHPQKVRELAETWSSVFTDVVIAPARATTY